MFFKKSRNKIFIGLCDIASFISDWDYGFEQLGIKTLKGSTEYQHIIQSSKLDFVIQKTKDRIGYFRPGRISLYIKPRWDRLIVPYYFNKAIRECDTFIFIWNSFKTDYSDYEFLKQLGKRIVTIFVGDEVRWYYAMKQEFESFDSPPIEYDNYNYSLSGLEERLKCLRTAEYYSDIIFGQPNYSQLSLKPYFNLNIPINANSLNKNETQRRIPIIIHAPSFTSIKGSKYIELIIKKLKEDGLIFEFKLLQNVPRNQAIDEYLNADIIIDQLLCPGGGKLAYECLAMGKVVLTFMAYSKYDQKKPSECPLIDINANTLYNKLKSLILDYDCRLELAKKGPLYIEKYHNPTKIVKHLLDLLSMNEDERTPDFHPMFFRNSFIPESKESIEIYNKWTEKIKEIGWYKKSVKTGERAGLKF